MPQNDNVGVTSFSSSPKLPPVPLLLHHDTPKSNPSFNHLQLIIHTSPNSKFHQNVNLQNAISQLPPFPLLLHYHTPKPSFNCLHSIIQAFPKFPHPTKALSKFPQDFNPKSAILQLLRKCNSFRIPLVCSRSPALTQSNSEPKNEERVVISEVLVRNVDGEELERKDVESKALNALKACRPNSELNVREVEEDMDRIIDSGYFRSCMPVAVDTRDGVRLVFQVQPNPEFRCLVYEGANVLPESIIVDSFRDEFGEIVNNRRIDKIRKTINDWYKEQGLVGEVSGIEMLSGGMIRLKVSEAEVKVNNIAIQFVDRKGKPTVGKTRPETILRELTTKKGQVYNVFQGKRDAQTVLAMGIMENVKINPQRAGDPDKVDLIMKVVEQEKMVGVSSGGGFSCRGPLAGVFGSCGIYHKNLFGKNQKLNLSIDRGLTDSNFRMNYKVPWIEGDDKRTSRSITIQKSGLAGTLVHNQPDGSLTIGRVSAGIEYSRPFRQKWNGTAGITFQRDSARDGDGNPITRDCYNCQLTASGNNQDDMLLAKLATVYTGSGGPGSSGFVFNIDQGLPVRSNWLVFNRVKASAKKEFVLGLIHLNLRLCGGHMVGNFPPHEAFVIGGTNTVRGYEEGAVGSGRSYVVGSGEISFPLLGPVEGVIFADFGTDLGSGPSVPGDPAGARNKPGSGYGYGVGLRANTGYGRLSLEYAFNDQTTGKFHFGIGPRN